MSKNIIKSKLKDINSVLIVKMGAAGDVVRTTPLLHLFQGVSVDWLVDRRNTELLPMKVINKVFTEVNQLHTSRPYDLVIILEDDRDLVRSVLSRISFLRIFGTSFEENASAPYTQDSSEWFDMSLISGRGLGKANELKLANRKSYQEILFHCLGARFSGEKYVLPDCFPQTGFSGDIAVAPSAGNRWPMKNWRYFDELISMLSKDFQINILPHRPTILEHLADVSNHRLVICNDSLPMHLALGLEIPTVAFFTCTSPWEIYDYGLLTKLVSPKLGEYFYQSGFSLEAVKAIPPDIAYSATVDALEKHRIMHS